jgi:hypothetical protein
MSKFNVGDKVICIVARKDHRGQPREVGHQYVVQAIKYCSGCGIQAINIMGKCDSGYVKSGCICGEINPNKGLWWTASNYFVKVDDIQLAIEEAVKEENYEVADILNKTK